MRQDVKPGDEAERATCVLVVDDEPLIRRTVARILRKTGLTVLEAEGAKHARALLTRSNRRVCLLVTDLDLADGDGAELARWTRAQRPSCAVLLTAAGLLDARIEGLGDPLRKPFDSQTLRSVVHQRLGCRASGVSLARRSSRQRQASVETLRFDSAKSFPTESEPSPVLSCRTDFVAEETSHTGGLASFPRPRERPAVLSPATGGMCEGALSVNRARSADRRSRPTRGRPPTEG